VNTTQAVLLGILLLLGLLFGLACFFLGPAGWLFWVLSMSFLAGCGVLYGLWRVLGIWVIGAPLLLLAGGGLLFCVSRLDFSGDGTPLGLLFVAVTVAIGLAILCPRRQR